MFRLPAQNRIAGLIEYIVVLPITALVLCLFIGAIGTTLVHWADWPGSVVIPLGVFLGLATLTWLTRFAIRDYRRRAGVAVAIDQEAVTVNEGRATRIPHGDVARVELAEAGTDLRCRLLLGDGSVQELPVSIAPFSVVQAPLEATLLPVLVARIQQSLDAGETVTLRESHIQATLHLLGGVVKWVIGALGVLTVVKAPAGLVWVASGNLAIRRGRRGRHTDLELTRAGLRRVNPGADQQLHEWKTLVEARHDALGLLLTFGDGRQVATSPFPVNFWPVAEWVKGHVPTDVTRQRMSEIP